MNLELVSSYRQTVATELERRGLLFRLKVYCGARATWHTETAQGRGTIMKGTGSVKSSIASGGSVLVARGILNCVECKHVIPESGVDEALGFVLCPLCDCGYDLGTLRAEAPGAQYALGEHGVVQMPANIHLDEKSPGIVVREEKELSLVYVGLFFSLLIAIFGDLKNLFSSSGFEDEFQFSDLAVFAPFIGFYTILLIGILLIGIHRAKSYQEIRFENGALVLRTPPFNIPRPKMFARDDMEIFYAKAHNIGVRHGRASTWEVRLMTRENKSHRLIYKLDNRHQALFFIRYFSEGMKSRG